MPKILTGKVVSNKMQQTVIVNITKTRTHPIYKKRIKKDKKIKVDKTNFDVKVGDIVKIIQTRPISKDKHFKILEVVTK